LQYAAQAAVLAMGVALGVTSLKKHCVVPHCKPEQAALLYLPAAQLVHEAAPPPLIEPAGQGRQDAELGAGA
jgi:hypothetical protein